MRYKVELKRSNLENGTPRQSLKVCQQPVLWQLPVTGDVHIA